MTKPLTVLSAFTGAGGMDVGLEAAGFTSVGCIEIDADARDTVKKNRDWNFLEPSDITELAQTLSPSDLGFEPGDLDLIAAGPPCQPFSAAAQWTATGRGGLSDEERAPALFGFFDIVGGFLPKAVLIENVPGFIQGRGAALDWMAGRFDEIAAMSGVRYELVQQVLNAADYGVPQSRRRALVVALRDSEHFVWPDPTHAFDPIRAWDVLRTVHVASPPTPSGEWADLLPSIPEGKNYLWHTSKGGGLQLFGYRTRYWSFLLKLSKVLPSWTISAQSGPASGPFHWDNRPLAIEEMAALQTFPVEWAFAGSDRSVRRQIGNATPPLLAEVAGRAIAEALDGRRYANEPALRVDRATDDPAPGTVEEVPEKYLHLVGEHPPHPGTGLGPAPLSGSDELG